MQHWGQNGFYTQHLCLKYANVPTAQWNSKALVLLLGVTIKANCTVDPKNNANQAKHYICFTLYWLAKWIIHIWDIKWHCSVLRYSIVCRMHITYMVRGLLAKQVQSSHGVYSGANVWQCLQNITLFGFALKAGGRTPQRTWKVGHPSAKIELMEKQHIREVHEGNQHGLLKLNTPTCPLLTAACWTDAVKMIMVANLMSSSKEVKLWGIPKNK